MNIFKKRPLCLILCIMLCGFSLFIRTSAGVRLAILGVGALALTVLFLIFKSMIKRTHLYFICCIAMVVSMLLSVAFTSISQPDKLYGEPIDIEGKITEIDSSDGFNTTMTVKTKHIGGKRHTYTLLVYFDNESAYRLSEGDSISFTSSIKEFSVNNNGFDERSYYMSSGYNAYCEDIEDLTVTSYAKNKSTGVFKSIRRNMVKAITEATNEQTGALVSALLVGDRSSLGGNTRLNFARIGISHILALSGMHLAILSFAISKLLSIFRLNRKAKVGCVSIFALFYMILTDFSPSITRAGIMIILSNILYLLMLSRDSYTNLSVAVFVILVFDPYSVYDISLWLSALATLGVIVIAELKISLPIKNSILNKLLTALINSLLFSVFAIGATLLICMMSFDRFSVIAPLGTVLFSFIIQIFIYLGILSAILPFFGALGEATIAYSDLLKELADVVASGKNAYVTYKGGLIAALIILYSISFIAFLVLKLKHKKIYALGLSCVFVLIFSVGFIRSVSRSYQFEPIYSSEKNGDIILIGDNSKALIYSGNCTSSSYYECYDLLYSMELNYLEYLILPEYKSGTPNFIEKFISGIKTGNVYLPKPTNEAETLKCKDLANTLSDFSTDIIFYTPKESIDIDGYRYYLINNSPLKEDSVSKNVILITKDGHYTTYMSSGLLYTDSTLANLTAIASHRVILGGYGKSYPDSYRIKHYFDNATEIIISNGTQLTDTLWQKYKEKGVSVIYTEAPISIKR